MHGLTVLLLLHRYPGIVHDSILCMGEGLAHQAPDIFCRDLFFMHGGQGQYSLMPWLLGTAFKWSTPPMVFLWGTLACLLAFAAASWHSLRRLLPPGQRYWAWLGILCLPSMYGVVSIFSYGEPFLTSHPIAEAFCLLAIGLLAGGHWRLAIACLAAGGLFHPLQAIGAALVVWPWLVMRDKRWLHAVWSALPVASLHRACTQGRTSHPDYVVLPYKQPQTALGEWRIPSLLSGSGKVSFRLYACADLIRMREAS